MRTQSLKVCGAKGLRGQRFAGPKVCGAEDLRGRRFAGPTSSFLKIFIYNSKFQVSGNIEVSVSPSAVTSPALLAPQQEVSINLKLGIINENL